MAAPILNLITSFSELSKISADNNSNSLERIREKLAGIKEDLLEDNQSNRISFDLPLGVLWRLTSSLQPVFLALFDSSIPGK